MCYLCLKCNKRKIKEKERGREEKKNTKKNCANSIKTTTDRLHAEKYAPDRFDDSRSQPCECVLFFCLCNYSSNATQNISRNIKKINKKIAKEEIKKERSIEYECELRRSENNLTGSGWGHSEWAALCAASSVNSTKWTKKTENFYMPSTENMADCVNRRE